MAGTEQAAEGRIGSGYSGIIHSDEVWVDH